MIGFNAEVDNLSNRNMTGSFLNLVEVVTYRATNKARTERRVVAEIRRGLIRHSGPLSILIGPDYNRATSNSEYARMQVGF